MTEPCPHSDPAAEGPAAGAHDRRLRAALVVPIALVLAIVVALFLPGIIGGSIFAVVAAAVLTMTAIAWRQLSPSARGARLALVLLLAAAAVVQLLPRGA